jgi:hypothetical protein
MTTPVTSSFFCFAQDVLGEGAQAICDAVERHGLGGLTVAVSYHRSRDFRPRQPSHRVEELPAGALYFAPARELYRSSGVEPWGPDPFATGEVLASLSAETARRGLELNAWTVFGFNERIGLAYPELSQVNAYGDRYATDLCPANSRYREYALALARDVAALGPARIVAESLHFQPLREGRRFFELDAEAEIALGLCFCEACESTLTDVDFAAVRAWAIQSADRAFAGDAQGAELLDVDELRALAGGQLGPFLDARAHIVTSLATEIAATAKLTYLDQVAASPQLVRGSPVDDAIRYGVDVAALGETCAEYLVLGYSVEASEVADAVAGYQRALDGSAPVHVALRPSWPDCDSAANLAAKVDAVTELGASGIHFYHYGLVSDAALDRVASVMGAAA